MTIIIVGQFFPYLSHVLSKRDIIKLNHLTTNTPIKLTQHTNKTLAPLNRETSQKEKN